MKRVFLVALVLRQRLMPLIRAPAEQWGSCGPKSLSIQRGSIQPLHSAAAEFVCVGANCFFNYTHRGNIAGCPLFEDDATQGAT